MDAGYRILLHTVTTGALVAELRPTSVRWSRGLNATGAAQVTVPTEALLAALPGDPRQYVGSTALAVLAPDGSVPFAGPVWQLQVALQGATTLVCSTWLSLLHRRHVRSTLTYSSTDQASIATSLVAHAQDTSGGRSDRALGIDTSGVAATGVARDRTYPGDEAKSVGEALVQLADVLNGFVFDLQPTLGSGMVLTHAMALTYPNSGVASATVLVNGANCTVATVTYDAADMATDVVALGGGSGDRLVQRLGGVVGGWPQLEAVRTWQDVTEPATLTAHASRALLVDGAPSTAPDLALLDVQASVSVDQLVRLVVPELGLDATYRVVALEVALVEATAQTSVRVLPADLYS